ncbi:MAG: DUF4198 domain-containing protein [Sphingobacterium sp.]
MKYILQQLVLMTTLLFSGSPLMAHALWIQTDAHAKQGEAHQVNIFYGEFATGEIDSVEHWYSNVPEFELWLHSPSGDKIQLETSNTAISFQSQFLPSETGTYTLSVAHPAKDLAGEYRYQFIAVAHVQVGQTTQPSTLETPLYLQHQPQELQVGGETQITVIAEGGKALSHAAVLLMSEEGWSKTFISDEQGKVNLPLPWKGTYVLEVSRTISISDQPYSKEWQGSTISLTVN